MCHPISYHDVGVRHIVGLRGDPATGIGTRFVAHPDGYKTSPDLVVKKRYPDIELSVSAYPERHFEARDFDGAGIYPDVESAAAAAVQVERDFLPSPDSGRSSALYEAYWSSYTGLAEPHRVLAAWRKLYRSRL